MKKIFLRVSVLCLLGGALSFVPAARADIPPPEGYVDKCTTELQATPETECVTCQTWHEAPKSCAELHGPEGYARKCRTAGATAWAEVLCRPKAGGAAAAAPVETKPAAEVPAVAASSSKCAGGGLEGSLGVVLAFGALFVARRRLAR